MAQMNSSSSESAADASQVELIADAVEGIQNDATCIACGYSLRGIGSRCCPECGRRFDLAVPETMDCPTGNLIRAKSASRLDRRLAVALRKIEKSRWAVASLGTAVMLMATSRTDCTLFPFWFDGLALWCVAMHDVVRRPLLRWTPKTIARRTFSILFMVLLVAPNFDFDQCPHATYLFVGPIHFSVAGSACGNSRSPRIWTWLFNDRRS